MKRVGSSVVASATLSLFLASASAEAIELDVDAVSDYSALLDLEQAKQLLEQVSSINQFNDVRPTDWAYQAQQFYTSYRNPKYILNRCALLLPGLLLRQM